MAKLQTTKCDVNRGESECQHPTDVATVTYAYATMNKNIVKYAMHTRQHLALLV